jgi:hypothetical protein
VPFTKYYWGGEIKEGDIGRAYGMRGEDEKQTDVVGGNTWRKELRVRSRSRWEDGVKVDIEGLGRKDVEWIHVAQNRKKRRNVVNKVMEHLSDR